MAVFNGDFLDITIESEKVFGNFVSNMDNRLLKRSGYTYKTDKYRSSTKSMMLYTNGFYEVPVGIYSTGSKTLEVYIWSYSVGGGKIGIYNNDGVLLAEALNTTTETWERVVLNFTASEINNYSLLLSNMNYSAVNASNDWVYFDDISLLN
jgi:hypothetical protein